jgi:hypothetical protein
MFTFVDSNAFEGSPFMKKLTSALAVGTLANTGGWASQQIIFKGMNLCSEIKLAKAGG